MSKPTRDERMRRQDHDDGDPDDTVYFVPRRKRETTGPASTKPRGSTYHEDPSCQAISRSGAEDPKETTRRDAKAKWLGPCTKCVLDGVPPKAGESDESDSDDGGKPDFFAPDLRGAEAGDEVGWP